MKIVKRKKLSAEEIRRNEQAAEEERQLELFGALKKANELTIKLFGGGDTDYLPDPALVLELYSSMMSTTDDGEFDEAEFLANMEKAKVYTRDVFGARATALTAIGVFDRVFLDDGDDYDDDEDEEEDEG